MFNTRIPFYAIFMLLAVVCELIILYVHTKKLNYTKAEIKGLLVYIFFGDILGGKYLAFITHYKDLHGIFRFTEVGYLAYGVLIGSFIVSFIFSIEFNKKYKDLFSIIMFASPIMYCVGKIACFLTGCCHGIEYSGLFSVTYNYSPVAPAGVSLFPIQLLESVVFLIIFIYIYPKFVKGESVNKLLGIYLFIGSWAKFLLDFLRMSHVGKILSLNQIIALIFSLLGLYLFIKEKKKEAKAK